MDGKMERRGENDIFQLDLCYVCSVFTYIRFSFDQSFPLMNTKHYEKAKLTRVRNVFERILS